MQTIEFSAGDTIISEGEDGQNAFLIVEGNVEVSVGDGSNAKTLAELSSGDVFGEMSLLEPGPRSATVKALENTKCVVTSYDDFMSLFQDNPEQAMEIMKTLVRRLRHEQTSWTGSPSRGSTSMRAVSRPCGSLR